MTSPFIDQWVRPLVLGWEAFKDWLSPTVHLTHHELHLVLGLTLFVGAAKLMRRPLTSFWPLSPVLGLELVNETSDFLRYKIDRWPWTPGPTLLDIAFTLALPLTLILILRLTRKRP